MILSLAEPAESAEL